MQEPTGFTLSSASRLAVLVVIASLIAVFFWLGGGDVLRFDTIKSRQAEFQAFYAEHRLSTILVYMAAYVLLAGCSVPGTVPLSLLAGALFGRWLGTGIVSCASTLGASVAFLVIRYLLRPLVETRLSGRLAAIRRGMAQDGAFYLFLLRITPIAPFFVVNAAMAVMPIRLSTFWWVSQVGMLPCTFLYVNAGTELAGLESWKGILSLPLIASFAALGVFPLVVKKLLTWFRGLETT